MNAWLLGGGAYVAALGFALALCRVAAPENRRAEETGGLSSDRGGFPTDRDELVRPGRDRVVPALD